MANKDDLKALGQQFVDAAKVAGNATYSAIPEFNNFAKASFIAPIVKQGIGGGANVATEAGNEADAADKAARDAQIQKLQDQSDPSKYTMQRKADGGFAFYDPSGKEIDINTYAKITGQRRADILKDSENPVDQQYINDYNNMSDLTNAIYNNDTDTIKAFQQQNPSTKGKTPQQLVQLLISKYPHMYGVGSYQDTFNNRNRKIFSENPNYISGVSGLSGLGQ